MQKILNHEDPPRPQHFSEISKKSISFSISRVLSEFQIPISERDICEEIFEFSLDNVKYLRHPGTEKMKTLSIFRRESKSKGHDLDSQIRVYRSHAARAISEERWEVAEIFLDRILKVDPLHTEAWLMKGHLRHHCREDEQTALDCYRKVINLCGQESAHPHAQRARTSLGRLLTVWG
jgi:hypothetical protein